MKTIAIIFFLITSNILTAQVTQEWVATYNGTGTGGNYPVKNAIDKLGNLIVAGRTSSQSTDYLVLKYNTSGNLLWSRSYDGIDNNTDRLSDMILDDSGNVYVTGSSKEGAANGYYNWLTIKYSPDGELRWKKSLDWTMHKEDIAYSITLDKDRNVFVAGYGWALPEGYQNFDIVVVKYDNNGQQLWARSFDSPPNHSDWGYSVVTDDSGYAYVSGYTYPEKIALIKYDRDGNEKWVREYPRMSGEYAIPLFSKIDKQNNIIINGYYQVSGQSNFVTLKYNRNGNLMWGRVFDSFEGDQDVCNSIYVDDSLNIYIAGRTQTWRTLHDILLIKYTPDGDTAWIRIYDDGISEHDEAKSITIDYLMNVYLTGETYFNHDNIITLKYNSTGNLLWVKKYITSGSSSSSTIHLDLNNNIFICGGNVISATNTELISIKYSQLTNINSDSIVNSNNNKIYNFPNPFNPKTVINYILCNSGMVEIIIFSIEGKELKKLIQLNHLSGNYQIEFDGQNLPSGFYFCSLFVNGNLMESIKMQLIK